MTSSPAVQSRYAHSPVARKRYGPGQFAETSPRTMIGLQKVNVQLQKEMDKLDRQAQTAVTNIANHQQAMKMSWRRLEEKRNAESPLLSRTSKHAHVSSPAPKQRWGVLSSNTRLYVHATPDIYRPREGGEKEGRGKEEGESEEEKRQSDVAPPPSVKVTGASEESTLPASQSGTHLPPPVSSSYIRSSPYITSPYNVRRPTPILSTRDHALVTTKHTSGAVGGEESGEVEGGEVEGGESGRRKSGSDVKLKLPPIQSQSQTMLVTHSDTVDKATLMQASQLMGLDSRSQGPRTFKSFYSDRAPSRSIVLSTPVQTPTAAKGNMRLGRTLSQEACSEEGVEEVSSEPSLAEMFEQIRNCRYIRHYHPDGTALEEYY